MFVRALLQSLGQVSLRREERLVADVMERRDVPWTSYLLKNLQRRRVTLSRDALLVGDWDCVRAALTQLGVAPPEPDDYPASLRAFLQRRVWRSTLAAVESSLRDGSLGAVFVKPAARHKRFTGRVVCDPYEAASLAAYGRREPVWCAEVVRWQSEHRVYVVGDDIVGIDCYDGAGALDMGVVHEALATLRRAGEAYAACGIDFGVLDTGNTALVERNDGVALGAYSLAAEPYTEVVTRRWHELVAGADAERATAPDGRAPHAL